MNKQITAQEPLFRMVKRDNVKKGTKVLTVAAAILAALVVDAVFIFLVTGLNPFSVYGVMLRGTFGNKMRLSWAVRDLASLLLVGIALAPVFKMKFWNIGAEGQILIGGLAAALVMVFVGDKVPSGVLFLVMFLASVLSGALWAFLPGFFKAYWKTNETLFTLMMNYVSISIVACVTNILRGRASSLGKLNMKTKAGWFPEFLGQRYNINILIALILTFAMFFYLKYTKHGYEISVVGESENTARYAGINVKKVIIRTMVLSGALCGLCGFLIVSGRDQSISVSTAGGRGFTAIIVAWLAKFNTFTMVLISFLLIFLERGAGEISSAFGLNDYVADIISGVILFFILGSDFFVNYKLIFRGKKAKEVQES
ncbi:MAG: ABC transporter permease [Lachnospiraceae bacterium]|nr:ABC transporter permease [Lachnospiraceae bacterium]